VPFIKVLFFFSSFIVFYFSLHELRYFMYNNVNKCLGSQKIPALYSNLIDICKTALVYFEAA